MGLRERRRRRAALAAALALGGLAPAAALAGAGPGEVLAKLNALREANGIPGGIDESPSWSRGCALHNAYLRANRVTGHYETAGAPGYTAAGARAGLNSALYWGGSWSRGNPWAHAPIHLAQILAPQLASAGANDAGGYVCLTTWPGYTRRAARNRLHAYPGNGAEGVPPSEVAQGTVVPGDAAGIPRGVATGPHLYLLPDGPWSAAGPIARVLSATVTGPDGPVEVRPVTETTPPVAGLFRGAILVLPQPLRPGALHRAAVTLENSAGTRMSRSWSFTTGRTPNRVKLWPVSWVSTTAGRVYRFGALSEAPDPALVATRAGGGSLRAGLQRAADGTWTAAGLSLGAGTWRVCLRSGGAPSVYRRAGDCAEVAVPASGLAAPPPAVPARRVRTRTVARLPSRARAGRPFQVFAGVRSSSRPRGRCLVERRAGRRWRALARGGLNRRSRCVVRARIARRGAYTISVRFVAGSPWRHSRSRGVTLRVR